MNTNRLHEILRSTTAQFRKGEAVERRPGVTEVFAMPHQDEAAPGLVMVDMELLQIGVNMAAAAPLREELVALLKKWPNKGELATGPSYITVGAVIGDQGAAFQLFALGKALDLWSVITPATFGLTGDEARRAAGLGYVMISGFDPNRAKVAAAAD